MKDPRRSQASLKYGADCENYVFICSLQIFSGVDSIVSFCVANSEES